MKWPLPRKSNELWQGIYAVTCCSISAYITYKAVALYIYSSVNFHFPKGNDFCRYILKNMS